MCTNKQSESFSCLLSDSLEVRGKGKASRRDNKAVKNRKRKERRKIKYKKCFCNAIESRKQYIKNLSDEQLTDEQITILSRGLKFIPTPVKKENLILPRIRVFYTLTKIHKPTPVGRPIISGCSGPTERISAFVDHLIQPIAQLQASYLKDTTDFINFIERIKLPKSAILVSMDVTSLYTNIPQREGITTVCHASLQGF